jgi:hypothetical protein
MLYKVAGLLLHVNSNITGPEKVRFFPAELSGTKTCEILGEIYRKAFGGNKAHVQQVRIPN